MKLFSSGFFQLNYEPSSDILFATLPDLLNSQLSQAEQCFAIIVEYVKNYHIQNLLLDSSQAVVELSDTAYFNLIYQVSMDLKQTRLKRVARIVSSLGKLEGMALMVQGEVLKSEPFSYQIQNFTNKALATEWLTGKPVPN